MSSIEYVLNSLAWSLLGFGAGWLGASLRYDVTKIREVVMHDENQQQITHPVASSARERERATRWAGVAIALLALATVLQGVIASARLNDVSACLTSYNERFAAAAVARAELFDSDRRALQKMLLTMYYEREASERQRLDIFREWVTTTERNESQRPLLPEYPSSGGC